MSKLQYKMCECPQANSSCCGGRGPAVFSVKRGSKKLNVCTRCDFRFDKEKKLIITEKYDFKTLMDFDPLGAFVVAGKLSELKEKNT